MANIGFVSSASSLTTDVASSLSVDLPSGTSASHVILMGVGCRDGGNPGINTPTGWTAVAPTACGAAVNGVLFYRVVDGTETATCTIVITSCYNNIVAATLAASGVETSGPVDVSASQINGSSASLGYTVVDTTVAETLLVYWGIASGARNITADAAITQREEPQSSASTANNVTAELCTEAFTTGPGTSTCRTSTMDGATTGLSWIVALKSASVAAAGSASTAGVVVVAVEMKLSGSAGAWTDVTNDVLVNPGITVQYGIQGNGPLDRLADTGTMSFALNNAQNNSGAKLGYYSPGHADARAGFELGISTRLALAYSGSTFVKFTGRLDSITPESGQYLGRKTFCTAVDWLDEAAKHKLQYIALQSNVRPDQAASTVVTNVPRPPVASTLYAAQDTWPYALDGNSGGFTGLGALNATEGTNSISELNKIVESEMGYLYIKGDTASGGQLVFEDRRVRQNPTLTSTIAASMVAMNNPRSRAPVYNRIYATAHPRTADASSVTVLYSLSASTLIPAGEILVIGGPYTDPALRSQRVTGACMVTPASTTDYTIGTGPGGTSETANYSVTACYGSNAVQYSIVRTSGGSANSFVTFLQARGAGIYDYSPDTYALVHANSSACVGRNDLSLDFPYEHRSWAASAFGDYVLSQTASPIFYNVDGLSFVGNGNDTLMLIGLQREPGDLVAITEAVTGLSASQYFINAVGIRLTGYSHIEFSWLLQRRTDHADYWQLDVDQLGGLGSDNESVLGI